MTDGYLLNLRTFREVRDDKAQALKPLEEAAEAFGAWQLHDDMRFSQIMTARREYRQDLIDECLDTVQATVNLLAAVGATGAEREHEHAAEPRRRDGRRPAGHREEEGGEMRFEITEVHVVDIPDSEIDDMDDLLDEIKDDAHWFIEQYEREAWCEEVTRLGRQL